MKKKLTQKMNLTFWCLLANFFVWGKTLGFGFVWDDHPTVEFNDSLRAWSTIWRGFAYDFWQLHNDPQLSGYWRPLVTSVYALTGNLLGFHAFWFHLVSLMLHSLNTVLISKLLSRAGFSPWPALVGTLFFAIHPLQAETVSFVSAWPDLMCAFGGLLLVLFLTSEKRSWGNFFYGVLSFVGCLLSKESGVIFLPVGIFLLRKNDSSWKTKSLVLIGVFCLYLGLHLLVANPWNVGAELVAKSWLTPWRTFCLNIATMVYPTLTSPLRSIASIPWQTYAIALGALVASFLAWFLLPHRRLSIQFIGALFILAWLPTSQLFPIETYYADRYFYLSLLSVGWVVSTFSEKVPHALSVVLLLLLGSLAWQSSPKWKSDETLWEATVRVSPDSAVAWNQLGAVQLNRREFLEAEKAFTHALALRPDYRETMLNRIALRLKKGDVAEAGALAEAYVESYATDAVAWDLLASAQAFSGQLEKALNSQTRAMTLRPYVLRYRYNMEVLLGMIAKRYEDAANWNMAKDTYQNMLKLNATSVTATEGLRRVEQILMIQREG